MATTYGKKDKRVKCSKCQHRAAVKKYTNRDHGVLIVYITCPRCHHRDTINLSKDN